MQAASIGHDALAQAMRLLQGGNPAEAATLCRTVLADNPADPSGRYLLGVAEHQMGHPFEAAAVLAPLAPGAEGGTSQLQQVWGAVLVECLKVAVQHHRVGRMAQAANIYRVVLALQPDQADALHLLGMVHRRSDAVCEAIHLMRRALVSNPGLGEADYNLKETCREALALAQTALQTGRYVMAEAHCRAVLSVQHDHADAGHLMGTIRQRRTGQLVGGVLIGDPDREPQRLAARVAELVAKGEPVKLHYGPGTVPMDDFINIDWEINGYLLQNGWLESHQESYFILPAGAFLPVPDASVDFVFHEDFFEHLSQKEQILFLVEMRRILKPGAVHRINTPCLKASMARHSDIARGAEGIYTGEWDKWGHVSVMTRHMLEEMAGMVGYSAVVFNQKGGSVSPFRCRETRPGSDRHPYLGNVFADLIR